MPTVNFYATLRAIVGQKTLQPDVPEGSSVAEVLEQLFKDYPALKPEILSDEGEIQKYVTLFVNGRDIRYLEALATPLQPGQVLDIFPPVAGG